MIAQLKQAETIGSAEVTEITPDGLRQHFEVALNGEQPDTKRLSELQVLGFPPSVKKNILIVATNEDHLLGSVVLI